MHLMPVRDRTRGMRRDDQLGGTETIIYHIPKNPLGQRSTVQKPEDSPVRLPSSIIRIVIVPSLNLSPAAAGTKFAGTCGTSRRRSCEGGGSRSGTIVRGRFRVAGVGSIEGEGEGEG